MPLREFHLAHVGDARVGIVRPAAFHAALGEERAPGGDAFAAVGTDQILFVLLDEIGVILAEVLQGAPLERDRGREIVPILDEVGVVVRLGRGAALDVESLLFGRGEGFPLPPACE